MNSETIEAILRWALAILPSFITALVFWLTVWKLGNRQADPEPNNRIAVRIRGFGTPGARPPKTSTSRSTGTPRSRKRQTNRCMKCGITPKPET